VGVHRAYMIAENAIENEFQYLYTLNLSEDTDFKLQASEVESLVWIPLSQFKNYCGSDQYVPHGELYYNTILSSIEPL
jgi:isopentenyldiphosphate isomerase